MMVRFAGFTFDSGRRLVVDGRDQPVHLSPKAFDLLALLIAEAPRVIAKADLHERLWPGTFVADATLVGVVKELRRALGDRDRSSPIIRTSHGYGYAFSGTPVAVDAGAMEREHWIVALDRRIALHPGENVIGRDPRSAVWLDVAGVSRRHARITITERDARLEDLGSKNGTRLDGVALSGELPLRDGDSILIGPISIQYRASDSGMTTETISVPI
jgi:DNA-binding winged helix-turn-helix (wHTH) protein